MKNSPPKPFTDKPVPPRDAATVVVMRDAPRGPEVYLVKRSREVDFMAGAHVFPGGRLDDADLTGPECERLCAALRTPQQRLGEALTAAHAGGLFVAAVRETYEEAGLRLDAAALVPWVRWVTPVISPRRFDARFFLARLPEGQEPRVDGREAVEGLWITPSEALQRWQRHEIALPPATARSIDALVRYETVDEALDDAASRTPPVLMPVVWNSDGRAFISLPGDPHHPDPDTLGGTIFRIQLEEGRYRAVPAG